MMLWRRRCRWPKGRKIAITVGIGAVLALIILPQTAPPDPVIGGIRVVSIGSHMGEVMGPEKPEGLTAERALIIRAGAQPPSPTPEPEQAQAPTPEPVIVYINDGGKYYHLKSCRYVYNHTPSFELSARIASLFDPCDVCNPPVFQ